MRSGTLRPGSGRARRHISRLQRAGAVLGRPRWQRYLDLEIAAKMAKVADVIDLQAQSLERSAATYGAFARQADGQTRGASECK